MSTLLISIEYFTTQKTACKVIFTSQDGFALNGDFLVIPMPRHVRTGSDGLASIVLLTGNYLLTFEGLGDDGAPGLPLSVPDDEITYKLKDRLGAPPVTPPALSLPEYFAVNAAALGITDLVGGGATNLDGYATLGKGSIFFFVNSDEFEFGGWEKIAGTQATDVGNGWLRPLDYNASTNAFVWKRRF